MNEGQKRQKIPYVSCIKINGVPILPPLITSQKALELRKYKLQAIKLEKRLEKCRKLNKCLAEALHQQQTRDQCSAKNATQASLKHSANSTNTIKCLTTEIVDVSQYSNDGITVITNEVDQDIPSASSEKTYTEQSKTENYPIIDFSTDEECSFLHELDLDCTDKSQSSQKTTSDASEKNCSLTTKPKLIRSNSYTLETPSPILLAHLEKLNSKTQDRNNPNSITVTKNWSSVDDSYIPFGSNDFSSINTVVYNDLSDSSANNSQSIVSDKSVKNICGNSSRTNVSEGFPKTNLVIIDAFDNSPKTNISNSSKLGTSHSFSKTNTLGSVRADAFNSSSKNNVNPAKINVSNNTSKHCAVNYAITGNSSSLKTKCINSDKLGDPGGSQKLNTVNSAKTGNSDNTTSANALNSYKIDDSSRYLTVNAANSAKTRFSDSTPLLNTDNSAKIDVSCSTSKNITVNSPQILDSCSSLKTNTINSAKTGNSNSTPITSSASSTKIDASTICSKTNIVNFDRIDEINSSSETINSANTEHSESLPRANTANSAKNNTASLQSPTRIRRAESPKIEVHQTDISVQHVTVNTFDKSNKCQKSSEDNFIELHNPDSQLMQVLSQIPEDYSNKIIELIQKQRLEQIERLERYDKLDSMKDDRTKQEKEFDISRPGSSCSDKLKRSSTFTNSPNHSIYYSISSSDSNTVTPNNNTESVQLIDLENYEDENKNIGKYDEPEMDILEISNSHGDTKVNRELFPQVDVTASNKLRREWAASVIGAHVKGYLIRRLLRTEKVLSLIETIKDALLCALELHKSDTIDEADIELHRRLVQQVSAACYAFHDIFFSLSVQEQMQIISTDRQHKIEKAKKRPSSSTSTKSSLNSSRSSNTARSSRIGSCRTSSHSLTKV